MFSLSLPAVIGAAIIDSINPCAFGVLIFLMTYLVALRLPKKMISVGLTYIVTVYIVYFLAGLGILSALASFAITNIIYKLSGILLIILGLVNLRSFLIPNSTWTLKIPESRKPQIEKWAKKASLPAAVVLGFLVSAFELPCTGGVYVAILGMLAIRNNLSVSISYLLLYNLFFILPLIAIWLFVIFTQSSQAIKDLYVKHKTALRLIMGIGMIGLGVAIFGNFL
jgi:cytochrome c biogenesis protein CcdA